MEHLIPNDSMSLEKLSFDRFREEVLKDYRLVCESREASLLGRKEVLTGKAKFGIFGDGKELPQVAMAKFFRPGDFYAGYYRDQTLAFASGSARIEEFFSQLYADPDQNHDPHSAGRQMNSHFATGLVDKNGEFLDLVKKKNITSGIAPTAGQMPRALGLAFASKTFRNVQLLKQFNELSDNGNEICFSTIGDASTSEGQFWETLNAAAVLQIPLAVFVWDDGYGISVPSKYQTTKGSISEAMKGFQKREGTNGIDIYKVKGWDYAGMCEIFEHGISKIRDTHIPALFHVEELTQPQGHSTSGSHERYKSPERLEWEREWDCLRKMKEWILTNTLADEEELSQIELQAKDMVRESRQNAWEKYISPIRNMVDRAASLLAEAIAKGLDRDSLIRRALDQLLAHREQARKDIFKALAASLNMPGGSSQLTEIREYYEELLRSQSALYNSHLYNEGPKAIRLITGTSPEFASDAPLLNGYEILNRYFDQLFAHNPKVVAFGEDLGLIGDVNQGFAGLQQKYGEDRIFDTGIRELTIMGQGIGMSMRGLRPIAEIQYIDYLPYGLESLTDDAATLHFRTKGKQSCPLIVRTRGHRLEGIWHSGSPMGMILNSLRGFHICVPRNMVQAAGMYNTLLAGMDPSLMIECLNGYRLKEKLPSNLLEFRVALGIPEVIKEGNDISIVTYGATLRIVMDSVQVLESLGISCEVVDVQTLLPFDLHHKILESLKKTSRIVFVDEDVPGGGAAYMFNKVMEEQGGYKWLDVAPRTITAQAHRPSYGSDGDYFSKPNAEQIVAVIREMMAE
jgi:pyruvate/2-oxoglutarate/acetoin dehydrogenase E1 component/TPP-dependent pyruvate/acetoin dehydrogenase alpha subunit